MFKIFKRIIILFSIIGLVVIVMFAIMNNVAIDQPLAHQAGPDGNRPGPLEGSNQLRPDRPEFQALGNESRQSHGPGQGQIENRSSSAIDIFKNLGIIAAITLVIIILRKGLARLKVAGRPMNS